MKKKQPENSIDNLTILLPILSSQYFGIFTRLPWFPKHHML